MPNRQEPLLNVLTVDEYKRFAKGVERDFRAGSVGSPMTVESMIYLHYLMQKKEHELYLRIDSR